MSSRPRTVFGIMTALGLTFQIGALSFAATAVQAADERPAAQDGAVGNYWSAADFAAVSLTAQAAMGEWGRYSVKLAEWARDASKQDMARVAFEIKMLELNTSKMQALNEALAIIEPTCASITDPAMRRHGLLLLRMYYVTIGQPVIDAAHGLFDAVMTNSQFADVRQTAATLQGAREQFELNFFAPRAAEIEALVAELGADAEKDGNGP